MPKGVEVRVLSSAPSYDGYERKFVLESKVPEMEALGFKKGYVLNRTDETL